MSASERLAEASVILLKQIDPDAKALTASNLDNFVVDTEKLSSFDFFSLKPRFHLDTLTYLVNESNIKKEDKANVHGKVKDLTEKKNKTTEKNEAIKEKREEKSKKAIMTSEQSMGIAKINN